MNNRKPLLYIGLGVLAALAGITLLLYLINRTDEYLILTGVIALFLVVYFVLLVVLNSQTGWGGENAPSTRVRSNEKLLVHLYPFKHHSYVLALYEPFDAEAFIEWVKTEWEREDADMGPLGSAYIGWTRMQRRPLNTLKNNTIVLPADTEKALREDPKLEDFFKQNTVIPY